MSSNPDPETFRQTLLQFVNHVLPSLQSKRQTDWQPVDFTTPLFENGLLDSLSILHLIATVEELIQQPVPDSLVSMKHFQSIETLTQTFCHENQ